LADAMLPEGTPAHIRSDNALRWSLRCYGSGWQVSAQRPSPSGPDHPGRTATASPSPASAGTNCSLATSSTA